ncbi:hypothetical protein ABBQ38_006299 [Trebouxia sp. C0009 RCD-2024]
MLGLGCYDTDMTCAMFKQYLCIGGNWMHFNSAGSWPRRERRRVYGLNELPVSPPNLALLIVAELSSPFVILQIVEISLFMWAFKYYIFPCVLAAILVAGCGVSAFLRHAQQLRLLAVASQPRLVPVVHKGCVRAMRAKYLVPGDVVVVQPGLAVCDMVLLQGHVLAEEARFRSGNSQVRKVPYEYGHDPEVQYHPDTCWPCTIFTGSVIQQKK